MAARAVAVSALLSLLHAPQGAAFLSSARILPASRIYSIAFPGRGVVAVRAAEHRNAAPAFPLSTEEAVVVNAIRDGVAAVSTARGLAKVSVAVRCFGSFGSASGGLIGSWLTPQRLEDCASFWDEGTSCLLRDAARGRLRAGADARRLLWLIVIALSTFPYTPLLLPLIERALEDKAPEVPAAYAPRRRAAWRRLRAAPSSSRRDSGGVYIGVMGVFARCNGDGCSLDAAFVKGVSPYETPQNVVEGAAFLRDGMRILARNVGRGRLFKEDKPLTYLLFGSLMFTTFPLTPLLLPLIDKRRGDAAGAQFSKGLRRGDYVPSVFSVRKLSALRRLAREGPRGPKTYAEAVKILHSAASATGVRPAPVVLLDAILVAQNLGQEEGAAVRLEFFDRLAGGGSPGRQWKLIYTASPSALRGLRGKKRKDKRRKEVPYLQGMVNKVSELLPWTWGLYVDAFVTAIQRFDAATFENENGVFALLGWDGVRFSVKGPFKWPQPQVRAVCAFRPTSTCVRVVGWEKVFSLEPGPVAFEDTPPTKLPFFKFVHVDDRVAVAIGRSGGAAVWARLDNVGN